MLVVTSLTQVKAEPVKNHRKTAYGDDQIEADVVNGLPGWTVGKPAAAEETVWIVFISLFFHLLTLGQ